MLIARRDNGKTNNVFFNTIQYNLHQNFHLPLHSTLALLNLSSLNAINVLNTAVYSAFGDCHHVEENYVALFLVRDVSSKFMVWMNCTAIVCSCSLPMLYFKV